MTDIDDRGRSGVVSTRVALAATIGIALLVAAALDAGAVVAAGVLGATVVGWSTDAVTADSKRRVAVGSVAAVAGSVGFVGGVVLADRAGATGYALVLGGTLVVAVTAWDGIATSPTVRFKQTVTETGILSVVTLVSFGSAFVLFGTGIASITAERLLSVTTSTFLAALWWLQVGALAAGLLADRAADVVDRWTPGEAPLDDGLASRFRLTVDDVPRWYLVALVGQFVLASTVSTAVDPFLQARPALARVVDVVVLSGVAQAVLGAVVVFLAGLAAVPAVRRAVIGWTGASPGYTLSFAAGGFAAAVGSLALGAVVAATSWFDWIVTEPTAGTLAEVLGVSATAIAVVVGALLATAVLVFVLQFTVHLVRPTGGGFVFGASALFAGVVLLANSLPAAVVVVGVAGCLFVWDVGVHAEGLERDLSGVRPSTRSEVVHTVAVAGAVLGGVVVAVAVGYLLVPLRVPDDRATVALALTLSSLVALAFAVRR